MVVGVVVVAVVGVGARAGAGAGDGGIELLSVDGLNRTCLESGSCTATFLLRVFQHLLFVPDVVRKEPTESKKEKSFMVPWFCGFAFD